MIVSDLELYYARDRFIPNQSSRYPSLEKDDPAVLHLLVRLAGAENIGTNLLVAVLHLKEYEPKTPKKNSTSETPITWVEGDRKFITSQAGADFTDFHWTFLNDRRYQIRVQFLLKDNAGIETIIGDAETELQHIIESEVERLEVDITTGVPEKKVGQAEFALEWSNHLDDSLLLEVRTKIQKKMGWPFTMTRPFFVLYRWEPQDKSWTPLYRSEVLTKVTDTPEAKGSMVFQIAAVTLKTANNGEDERPLRLEFFHYKTTETPKMLGYLLTSLLALRQSKINGKLNLELNTFPEGELSGQLLMSHKRITATRCLFTLQAEFGGPIVGDFVYFNLSLTLTGNANQIAGKKFGIVRPYFVISRLNPRGDMEHVYRSETSSRVFKSKFHKFKLAKLTKKKLNGGFDRRSLSIKFYHERVSAEPVELGDFETSIGALMEASVGSVFPISVPESEGYVRLQQFEESSTVLYFFMNCVIGDSVADSSYRTSFETEESTHRTIPGSIADHGHIHTLDEHSVVSEEGSVENNEGMDSVEITTGVVT